MFPKPKSVSRQARNARQERLFRDAVWRRDGTRSWIGWMANCARCHVLVKRDSGGEVDHIKPRSTHPELKYDPANARIVCRSCNRYLKLHPRERVW